MLGGVALETIYWYVLLISAGLAVVLVIFGDILDFDGPVDPILIIPWLAFVSLIGYIGEKMTDFSPLLIFVVGAVIATSMVFLLNFYVFMPLRHAEATISFSERDLEGRVATVITPIPVQGMGEIQIKNVTGSITRPASFYSPQDEAIAYGKEVLIIEIKERVCYVVPYQQTLIL